ncbi:TetR family transcriptional regulator C-terminal domain-containing protein [Streptomyces sp. NPDC002754]
MGSRGCQRADPRSRIESAGASAPRARCAARRPRRAADDGPGRDHQRRAAVAGHRSPVTETIAYVESRIAEIAQEALESGELAARLVPREIAAAVVATVQGGYVLARASGDAAAFDAGVRGLLALLSQPERASPPRGQ